MTSVGRGGVASGQIAEMPRVALPSSNPGQALDLPTVIFFKVQEIIAAINGRLSLGNAANGKRSGNLDGQWLTVLSAGAGVEFPVFHGLERKPVGVLVSVPNKAASIYSVSKEFWTRDTIYLTSSASATTVDILVF